MVLHFQIIESQDQHSETSQSWLFTPAAAGVASITRFFLNLPATGCFWEMEVLTAWAQNISLHLCNLELVFRILGRRRSVSWGWSAKAQLSHDWLTRHWCSSAACVLGIRRGQPASPWFWSSSRNYAGGIVRRKVGVRRLLSRTGRRI